MLPEGSGLFAGITVAENPALGRLARSTDGSNGIVWSEEHILHYFPCLRECMNAAADYLSGGEQQMVKLARALSGIWPCNFPVAANVESSEKLQ